jgi:putative acetyltransferase
MKMNKYFEKFLIRNWQKEDREKAATVIRDVLTEYGLPWQPETADKDVIEIETAYLNRGGEFWVVEQANKIVGTGAYYPITRGDRAVEIRKMYLLPSVRGKGIGRYLLKELENTVALANFQEIWLETASVLKEAVRLYEKTGYHLTTGVETARCDRVYVKRLNNLKDSI